MNPILAFWLGGCVVEYVHQRHEGKADVLLVLGWPVLLILGGIAYVARILLDD